MASRTFRHLNDAQLVRLSDDELIDYLRRARAAGEHQHATLALQILVYRNLPNIERRVSMKVSAERVDEVAGKVMIAALFSSLSGQSRGEFHSWLNQIIRRRIADYYRANRVEETPLGSEHEGDEDVWGLDPVAIDEHGATELMTVVDGILEDFSDTHRQVIDLYAFQRAPAAEVAAEVNAGSHADPNNPMTANNVHKIGERFRKKVREALEEGDSSP